VRHSLGYLATYCDDFFSCLSLAAIYLFIMYINDELTTGSGFLFAVTFCDLEFIGIEG
jgi:hypothetical protein